MSTTTVSSKQKTDTVGCGSSCQFWNRSSFRCNMRREGVFIPLAHDITTYCLTDNFTSCPRYMAPAAQRPRKLRVNGRETTRRHPSGSALQVIQQPLQAAAPTP
jgi:hypothetical protein